MGEKITKMDRQPIISAKDVEITFSLRGKKLNAIRKCSLDLYDGETLAIVGESGSGKSTLMQILVGGLAADAGAVELQGALGYCPQRPVVFERLTCDEHFELFAVAYGMSRDERLRAQGTLYEELDFGR